MPKVKGTPEVRFNLHNLHAPETWIMMYFHYKGKRLKYSAGEKVRPQFWDMDSQRTKPNKRHPEYTDVNLRLDELKRLTVETYRKHGNGKIEVEDFRLELDRLYYGIEKQNEKETPQLMAFIEAYIEEKKSQPRGTWKVLHTVSNLMKEYEREQGRKLSYENIDSLFFGTFKSWLYKTPRNHSINYASKVFDTIRQFLREGIQRGHHANKDFERFVIKKEKTTKIALSFAELELLGQLDLSGNERLSKARNLFLIGAYTGLRFSDFTRIKPDHIETQANGTKILTMTTQKTGEVVSIPLFPIPEEILRCYDFEVPKLSNQKMNDYLKELGEMAGLDKSMIVVTTSGGKRQESTFKKFERISTHVARRSFATNFYQKGIPAITLMKITGHTTERQFMQYIAVGGKENALAFASFVDSYEDAAQKK
jgi:integrase